MITVLNKSLTGNVRLEMEVKFIVRTLHLRGDNPQDMVTKAYDEPTAAVMDFGMRAVCDPAVPTLCACGSRATCKNFKGAVDDCHPEYPVVLCNHDNEPDNPGKCQDFKGWFKDGK